MTKPTPLVGLDLSLNDAARNLALEEALLRSLQPGGPGYFLLWRNRPAVIVGRHQHTAAEVNTPFLDQHGIPAVRRITGGGAVYHDRGNLNYSFLLPAPSRLTRPTRPHGPALLDPLLKALDGLGVRAECSGRNDITVEGRKISGTAQYVCAQGSLFHGAMLVDVDLDRLVASLSVDPEKYRSKALVSVRSRVANLVEFLPPAMHDTAVDQVAGAFLLALGCEKGRVPSGVLAVAETLAREKYGSWDWNHGTSPPFTEIRKRRFVFGTVECCYDVRAGVIQSCRLRGDFFAEADIAELEEQLQGTSRNPADLAVVLETVQLERFFVGCDTREMTAFLCGG